MSDHAADLKKHVRAYILVFVTLMALTLITVAVSTMHLEVHQAIIVALIIATVKGSLVACYFMHLISEKNPVREMASFWLRPGSGRAEVSSRIRLNGSQRMVAIAELSDGSFWSDALDIEVLEAACTDGG